MVLTINMVFGLVSGMLLENLVRFIAQKMTIGETEFQNGIIFTLFYTSILALANYQLIITVNDHRKWTTLLNVVGYSISLIIVFVLICKHRCLVSNDGFNLIGMDDFEEEKTKSIKKMAKQKKANARARMPRNSSQNSMYMYQTAMATARLNTERNSSISVLPYRIKYRIDSVASIQKYFVK